MFAIVQNMFRKMAVSTSFSHPLITPNSKVQPHKVQIKNRIKLKETDLT